MKVGGFEFVYGHRARDIGVVDEHVTRGGTLGAGTDTKLGLGAASREDG